MANSDKNLVITPNVGSSASEPTINFSGADSSLGAQSLQARIYPIANGTLSFEGSVGQLFSITNNLTGTVYSVNDISGLPSIEVFDSGVIRLARYSGRVVIGNITDNGVDTLQFATGTSISLPNINSTGNLTATNITYSGTLTGGTGIVNIGSGQVYKDATGNLGVGTASPGAKLDVTGTVRASNVITSTLATGTAPFTIASTTVVTNLNVDKVDGVDIGTLTAAGGIAYATSTTALAATAAGTAGQAVLSGGAGAPTFQTVASANGASTIVARDVNGSFIANTVTATHIGDGSALTSLNGTQVTTGTVANARTTAASANGASTIVARDSVGSFTAATVSATLFSGSGASLTNIPNSATTAASANGASTIVTRDSVGSFTAATVNATLFSGSGASLTNIPNSATTAASANGASTIVARDSVGSFNANTVTATHIGDGSALTSLNGTQVTTGQVANARTTASSANVASAIVARDVNGSFIANNVTATLFSGSGASLTNIPNSATTSSSANGASTIVARDVNGSFIANTVTATHIGDGSALTSLNGTQVTTGTVANARTTAASANGALTIVSRDADGSFAAKNINVSPTVDTATAASHYFVENASDGVIRPKTLANAQAEIVTAASVYAVGVTASTATQSFVQYNSTTATAGAFDGGATAPTGTTRLNYGGYLYATRYYTSNIYDLTGAAGTPTIYPDVTTGSVSIANGLTTGTLNLGATGVGAKTVNIGTSTGTTIVYGSTVRLPNAGTPGAGKYLQSDASGNGTWQTIVAGATITNDTTTNSDAYYPGLSTATSGAWTAAYTSSTKLYYNPSTGQLNATNFNSLSDATKKENVNTIENATEKTLALRGVTFDWIDTKLPSLGVIAQEVEQIIPDAVSTSSSGEKSVNYGSLVGLLIQTIKEQNARIEKLESLITR